MPITLSAIETQRILQVVLTDPWTMDELKAVLIQDNRLRDNATHPYKIHALVDLTHTRTMPPNVLQARHSSSFVHPTRGELVIFGANTFVKILADTVSRLIHFDAMRFFNSEAEALAYLRQVMAAEEQSASLSGAG